MGKKRARVLAVMAHPDDVEILVGGTLLHLAARGWQPGIITMTAGDCGSDGSRTKEEIARIRYGEAQAAADSIGAWYACAGLVDIEIFANVQSVRRLVELLREFAPDVVLTHSPADYMLDHEETSRIVRAAAFAVAMPLYQTRQVPPAAAVQATPALYYADPVEGIDALGQRVPPHFYVDISEQIEKKRQLLSHHASQRDWLRKHHGIDEYLDRMTEWASGYGRECGVAYAEGLRQHLGHGYPQEPRLQEALAPYVYERRPHVGAANG